MDSLQNKLAFVTGVSSGIGEALAKSLLSADYEVVGIGRKAAIQHSNFSLQQIDLSDTAAVTNFKFNLSNRTEILLVNNAGIIGEIAPVGQLQDHSINDIIKTNVIAPQILCNKFIHTFLHQIAHIHIINISSGAGKRPIDAWATYCSSKAAIDLFSVTIQEEMAARQIKNFFIHSLAPGIVDTVMQQHIRAASPDNFLASRRFHDLKNNNELTNPTTVAEAIVTLAKNPQKNKTCLIAVGDIQS